MPTKIKGAKKKRSTNAKTTRGSIPTYRPRQKQTQGPSITKTTDDSSPTHRPRQKQTQRPSITKTTDDSSPIYIETQRKTQRPSITKTTDDSTPIYIEIQRETQRPSIIKTNYESTFTPSIVKQQIKMRSPKKFNKVAGPTALKITLRPSQKLSLFTNQKLSLFPSQKPSLFPSQKPSSIPSRKPSPVPSGKPSPISTSTPSSLPTTDYILCNKNCPVKPNPCGFYETCGNGCWCGRLPPTPSSFPTLAPTQNLFIITHPTMTPYNVAILPISVVPSPVPTFQPSSKSTQIPTTFLPSTISPTTSLPTLIPSQSPTFKPPMYLSTLFPSPLPSSYQTSNILSSNGVSSNSSTSSITTITGAVVGSIILLIVASVIIYCFIRKNKKQDAFTKWRMHYDVKTPARRDTPATIENDIHHFYKRNSTTRHSGDFTPYVSTSQRNSQRSSLKPQPMSLPMVDYNRNSVRL